MKKKIQIWLSTIVLFVLIIGSTSLKAQTNFVEYVWPNGAPDAKGVAPGDKPTLTFFLPAKEKATGAAVLICPGGGYAGLAADYEGDDVARWFNSFGVAGIVLRYRHSGSGAGYRHPTPLNDAQRSMSIIRSKAIELNIDPGKIGVAGFSAGGHLASSLGTHFNTGNLSAIDPIERISCRPDFMILVYPVITMNFPYVNQGSRENLLGKNPDQKLVDLMSNDLQVNSKTPPAFIVHTTEDSIVTVENSLMFYSALRKAGVPVEMHIFLKGKHGYGLGLGKNKGEVSNWPVLCEKWMQIIGITK
jgi:acetyl esterase/lipase